MRTIIMRTAGLCAAALATLTTAAAAAAQDGDAAAITRYAAGGAAADLPFSSLVAHGDVLYAAGVIGFDPETGEPAEGIGAQTTLALEALERALGQAGADRAHVLSCTVFLKDMGDYAAMNVAFGAFFGDAKPARTTVQATPPVGAALEISCTAARPVGAPGER